MQKVDKDLLLYSTKILNQYVEDHDGEGAEIGRVVSALQIITPILSKINNLE